MTLVVELSKISYAFLYAEILLKGDYNLAPQK